MTETKSDLNEQIEHYRALTKRGLARHFHRYLLAASFVCIALGVLIWNLAPVLIGAFIGLVGVSERKAGPNIEDAILAYDSIEPKRGEVEISEINSDSGGRYRALVSVEEMGIWEFEFIPQLWKPEKRTYPAKVWFNPVENGPSLVCVEDGICIPRYTPKKAQTIPQGTSAGNISG